MNKDDTEAKLPLEAYIDAQAEREGIALNRHRNLRPKQHRKVQKKYYPAAQRHIRAIDNTEFTKMLTRILY